MTDPERMVGSASYADQMAVVNVWATWCPGCRQEHGFLMELAEKNIVPIFGLNWRDNRPEALRWLDVLVPKRKCSPAIPTSIPLTTKTAV